MSSSCLGTEFGLLFFSCSVQFIQLVYLKKEKGKKKGMGNLFSLCVLHQSMCPDAAPRGLGMDRAPRLVTLIYSYKCTRCFSLHIAGGLLLGEGGKELAQRPGGSCVTHLCAGLLQQPKWQRDSQQAPCPGMLDAGP